MCLGKLLCFLHFCRTTLPSIVFAQFSSVAQACLTLWDSMDWSPPGFLVHHQLPELTQTHVHWVSDAIQPSIVFLVHNFFSFNILSMSPNCLLTCKISAEKSTNSLVEIQWLPIILKKKIQIPHHYSQISACWGPVYFSNLISSYFPLIYNPPATLAYLLKLSRWDSPSGQLWMRFPWLRLFSLYSLTLWIQLII